MQRDTVKRVHGGRIREGKDLIDELIDFGEMIN